MKGLICIIVAMPILIVFGSFLLPFIALWMLICLFMPGKPSGLNVRQPKW